MSDLERALALVVEHQDEADFVGPPAPGVVGAAETALGLRFPPTYRRFVEVLGAGDIGGEEFYGISSANFISAAIPNGVWFTLRERQDSALPKNLVLIYGVGDGTYYALDAMRSSPDGEYPVIAWELGASMSLEEANVVAPDFGAFFLTTLREALAE